MADLAALREQILRHGHNGLVNWPAQIHLAESFGRSLAEVEEDILTSGLLPARYARNRSTISSDDQLRLRRARVGVVGCGGIGGHVVEGLARLGVGKIVAVDPDCFEESNLNRQLFSSIATLGQAKVDAAVERIAEVNPAVTVIPCRDRLTRDNGAGLLRDCAVVVDALDSIAARLDLAAVCDVLEIPMVHAAIAGWYGQVTVRFPGETILQRLYGQGQGAGEQVRLGNPSFTPAVVAAFEVAEVCKILIGQGESLRGRALMIDLREGAVDEIRFADDG